MYKYYIIFNIFYFIFDMFYLNDVIRYQKSAGGGKRRIVDKHSLLVGRNS